MLLTCVLLEMVVRMALFVHYNNNIVTLCNVHAHALVEIAKQFELYINGIVEVN